MRVFIGLISLLGIAQAFAITPPDAGQSLRDLVQAQPALPPKPSLELNLPEAETAPASTEGPRIAVGSFRLTGLSAFTAEALLPLLTDLAGRELSLVELQAAAGRISLHYREHGYPLAQAYVPAQTIEDGTVEIAVLEGRYGDVRVQNDSRLKPVALKPVAALKPGDAVRAAPLERALLLLQDLPGVSVQATLAAGEAVGSTDLHLQIQDAPWLSGSLELDNHGNRFTGEYRLGGSLSLNNPLGLGDRLNLRLLGSDESQLYYRLAYQLPVGVRGARIGVAYSDMDYQLGKDFANLEAHGRARTASAWLQYPLWRGRDMSMYTQLQFDDKRLSDEVDLFGTRNEKRARVFTASLSANGRDKGFGGGLSSVNLSYSHGSLTLDDAAERLLDRATAGTAGQFNKLNLSLLRLQRLSDRFSLYTQVQAQWADGNLDSSEKLGLGGAYGVRAYPQGEASGDQGWLANLELRYALNPFWQVSAFVDHGRVRLNRNPWVSGDTHREISANGLGVSWSPAGWRLNAAVAWKLGTDDDPQSDVDRSPRAWVQLQRAW